MVESVGATAAALASSAASSAGKILWSGKARQGGREGGGENMNIGNGKNDASHTDMYSTSPSLPTYLACKMSAGKSTYTPPGRPFAASATASAIV